MPKSVNHLPLPLMPFFPLIIKSPVPASVISARAKISAIHVHNFLGLFKCRKLDSLKTDLLSTVSKTAIPFLKLADSVFLLKNISIEDGLDLK